MKKIYILLSIIILAGLFFISPIRKIQAQVNSTGSSQIEEAIPLANPQETRDMIRDILGINIPNLGGDKTALTPGAILSAFYPFMFVFAGLILFVMLVWGGFEMLTGVADTKAVEAGKQRISWALIGLVLIFVAYWIGQIIQIIFGINIFGNI